MPNAFLLVLSVSLFASELGVRIGERIRPRIDERKRAEQDVIQASVLGLLALLLGVSFAMAESRFDARKQVVLDDVVAIGTADLRTQTVRDPPGAEIHTLLRDYVRQRLLLDRRNALPAEELESTGRLEREAWPKAAALAKEDPRSIPVGLLLQSLNQVIDLNQKRVTVTNNHVPLMVWVVLLAIAAVAMGWDGMCLALSGSRSLTTRLTLALAIALTTAAIVDLDQPRRGLIRVSEDALVRVYDQMAR
jgi:hypothetical protein